MSGGADGDMNSGMDDGTGSGMDDGMGDGNGVGSGMDGGMDIEAIMQGNAYWDDVRGGWLDRHKVREARMEEVGFMQREHLVMGRRAQE